MTEKEALTEILSSAPNNGTWYSVSESDTECTWLRVTALRIKQGKVKPSTMRKFFNKFGYEVEVNMEVRKK